MALFHGNSSVLNRRCRCVSSTPISQTLQGSIHRTVKLHGEERVIKIAEEPYVSLGCSRNNPNLRVKEDFLEELANLTFLNDFEDMPEEIIKVFDEWENEEDGKVVSYCMEMECIEGMDTFDWMSAFWTEYLQTRNITKLRKFYSDVRFLFSKFIAAVGWMHSKQVAHLDLSPENILLVTNKHGEAVGTKIIDFGVSHRTDDGDFELQGVKGKKFYMAPEVVSGGTYDARAADIWSCGTTLLTLLAGTNVIKRASLSDRGFRFICGHSVTELLKDTIVSDEAKDLLDKMLQPESTRISMEDILRHPYVAGTPSREVAGEEESPSRKVSMEMLDSIRVDSSQLVGAGEFVSRPRSQHDTDDDDDDIL